MSSGNIGRATNGDGRTCRSYLNYFIHMYNFVEIFSCCITLYVSIWNGLQCFVYGWFFFLQINRKYGTRCTRRSFARILRPLLILSIQGTMMKLYTRCLSVQLQWLNWTNKRTPYEKSAGWSWVVETVLSWISVWFTGYSYVFMTREFFFLLQSWLGIE